MLGPLSNALIIAFYVYATTTKKTTWNSTNASKTGKERCLSEGINRLNCSFWIHSDVVFSDLNALMQQCHCKTIHFIWKRHFHFHFVDFYIWKICPMDNCPDKYKQKYVYCLRNRRKILQNLSTMYVTIRPEEYLRLKMWLFS